MEKLKIFFVEFYSSPWKYFTFSIRFQSTLSALLAVGNQTLTSSSSPDVAK